jgi:uncharacterized protein (DUF433 family)
VRQAFAVRLDAVAPFPFAALGSPGQAGGAKLSRARPVAADEAAMHGDRITMIPGLMGGRPTVRGLRFAVSDVLEYLAAGMSVEDLLGEFPFLEREDVLACLEFAAYRR